MVKLQRTHTTFHLKLFNLQNQISWFDLVVYNTSQYNSKQLVILTTMNESKFYFLMYEPWYLGHFISVIHRENTVEIKTILRNVYRVSQSSISSSPEIDVPMLRWDSFWVNYSGDCGKKDEVQVLGGTTQVHSIKVIWIWLSTHTLHWSPLFRLGPSTSNPEMSILIPFCWLLWWCCWDRWVN